MGRLPELVLVAGLAVTEARAAPRSAADCDVMVQAAPHALASYRCYWDLAHTGRRMEGSLWPLRDDESSVLLKGFYRGLARGNSVAEAMAGARRERIGAGAVTAAWAGMVVLGDGAIRPLAAGPDPGRRRALAILVLAASAFLALVGGLRLRERRRPSRS